MRVLETRIYRPGDVSWETYSTLKSPVADESVLIRIVFSGHALKKQALGMAVDILQDTTIEWFVSGGYSWTLDLDKLRSTAPEFSDMDWLRGRISVEPEYHLRDTGSRGFRYEYRVEAVVFPEDVSKRFAASNLTIAETMPSLAAFRGDHPKAEQSGFIMMRFEETRAHRAILDAIRDTLGGSSLEGLRSDDKEYADEVLTNIKTYIHGCGFGVAVFERLSQEEFNPNISLEVGYMMALGKPVLFLKDKTLRHLHTDVIGRLYRPFDPQHPKDTIPNELESWLRDKDLIRRELT